MVLQAVDSPLQRKELRGCFRLSSAIIPVLLFVLFAFVGFAPSSSAEQTGFSLRVKDELRMADVEIVRKQGVAYISLPSLIRQIGGGCTVTPDRVQVDLVAKTAWLRLNSGEVSSSLGDFILSHPVIESGDEALIALTDAIPFFDKAFFLDLRTDSALAKMKEKEPIAAEPASTTAATLQPLVPPEPPSNTAATPSSVPQPALAEPAAVATKEQRRPVERPIQVIVVDAGHGGSDAGCQTASGTKESALNLAMALKAQKALQAAAGGAKVVLTRDKEQELTRRERSVLAESNKGDLFIAIHCGASLAPSASGFEVFCCGVRADAGQQIRAAADEYAARSHEIGAAVAEALATQTGSKNSGVRSMPCAVLSDVQMAGILIEVGCMTNSTEETLLRTEEYQDKIAQGIAAGIAKILAGKGSP